VKKYIPRGYAVTLLLIIVGLLIFPHVSLIVNNVGANTTIHPMHLDGNDTTPPTTKLHVRAEQGKNGWYISQVVIILEATDETVDPNDEESGVWHTFVRIDGGNWNEYSAPIGISIEGYHYIEYYSIDYAGNEEQIHNYSFKIDKYAPSVNLIYPNGGEILSGTITIQWAASDTIDANLSINLDYNCNNITNELDWQPLAWNEINDGTYEWNVTTYDEREYWLRISAFDDAGHKSVDISDSQFIVLHPPPVITILRPQGKHLYLFDREIVSISKLPVIIGKITIMVNATSINGVDEVAFYIDGVNKAIINQKPYSWVWDEKNFGKHTIKTIAFDNADKSAYDIQEVWIFNVKPFSEHCISSTDYSNY